MNRLPIAFEARMQALLGDRYAAFAETYDRPSVRALFLNERRLSGELFERNVDFSPRAIPELPGGYLFDTDKPGNHPFHHAGGYYVQDPSAMATVSAAPLSEGMKCLDVCASPGGKSVQLACGIGESGFLVSNEINPSRCKTLYGNLERMGFGNTFVTNADAKRLANWYPCFFDLVLVDAPCSGEGMFRKYENATSEWSEGAPAFCASRQREILKEAVKTVCPGGYLLYSTCTYSLEENEQTVEWLLREEPSFTLCDLPERVQRISSPGVGMPQARRFYPHVFPGEGQFVALLQRSTEGTRFADGAFRDVRRIPGGEALECTLAFLEDTLQKGNDLNLCALGERMVACSQAVPGENLFSAGVTLGTVEKRRLVPHHQLFKAFGDRFLRKLDLKPNDPLLKAYLSGAEIPCTLGDGWAVVTVCGVPLGGIKVKNGVAKNHYPKGLRTFAT